VDECSADAVDTSRLVILDDEVKACVAKSHSFDRPNALLTAPCKRWSSCSPTRLTEKCWRKN